MTGEYWNIVNKIINHSDIILLVLDARNTTETRHAEIEDKVKEAKKPLIYVITKIDLVKRSMLNKIRIRPISFVSARNHQGTTKLREKIMIEGKKTYPKKENFVIGVVGYPNVGKSSLINAMKGKKSAPTSATSGYTKAMQKIKGGNKLTFYDTPGVIPYKEKDKIKHAIIGGIDFNKVKDPYLTVIKIIETFPGKIQRKYLIFNTEDPEEIIEKIAIEKNLYKKGKEPDIERAARMILKKWQKRKEK